MRIFPVALLAAVLLAAPAAARACPACRTGKEGIDGAAERRAYLGTTALLIAVPFLGAAGLVVWLRRAQRHRPPGPREA